MLKDNTHLPVEMDDFCASSDNKDNFRVFSGIT
jgi:hypothetical protein